MKLGFFCWYTCAKYIVKPDGNVRDHYNFDEYGKPAPGNSKQSPDGAINLNNTFGYTGEMWDEEDNLLYLRARYYEPETGRFLSRDSYAGNAIDPLSLNKYAYVTNNPLKYADPSGNIPIKVGNTYLPTYLKNGKVMVSARRLAWALGYSVQEKTKGSHKGNYVVWMHNGKGYEYTAPNHGLFDLLSQWTPRWRVVRLKFPEPPATIVGSAAWCHQQMYRPKSPGEILEYNANAMAQGFLIYTGTKEVITIGRTALGLSELAADEKLMEREVGALEGASNALVKDTGNIVKNTENLQKWAKDMGWEQQFTEGGVEMWGVRNSDGVFSWRLKIKLEASTRPGLGAGSSVPRFDARLDASGTYINPFTGEIGGKAVGTHIPLGD